MSSGSWVPRWRRMRRSSTCRKRRKARARAGWASMARPAVSSGSSQPVRSNRLPAMMRMPGPSQVSRAWASSPVRATLEDVASGVSSRSLTTMMRRPRGTSTRVPPGSGAKAVRSARRRRGPRRLPPGPRCRWSWSRPLQSTASSALGWGGQEPWTARRRDLGRRPSRAAPGRAASSTCADQHPRGSSARRDRATSRPSRTTSPRSGSSPRRPHSGSGRWSSTRGSTTRRPPLGPEFWAQQAGALDWFRPWDTVLSWDLPFARWFDGGTLNVSYNCLDRHVAAGRGDKVAFHWEGEPGDTRTISYADLLLEVCRFANVLRGLGVARGDRVAVYMPMVPELAVAMLACARIGAVHSVVFGGFSSDALRDRILDAEARVVVTADGGWRRGQGVGLKGNVDVAVAETPVRRPRGRGGADRRRHGGRARGHDRGPGPLVARADDGRGRGGRRGARRARASPSTWRPRTCSSSCTRRAPRPPPRGSCTRPAAT